MPEVMFTRHFCKTQRVLPSRENNEEFCLLCPAGEEPSGEILSLLAWLYGTRPRREFMDSTAWEAALDALHPAGFQEGNDVPENDRDDREDLDRQARQAPVVTLAEELLRTAVLAGASDLHLEAIHSGGRARIRVDGQLRFLRTIAPDLYRPLLSRLKVLSRLNIMERRQPQDGRMGFSLGIRKVEIRLSIIPARWGESVVLRILEGEEGIRSLDAMGLDGGQLALFRAAMGSGSGMILLSGPTGSGKSSSLHALLASMRNPGIKIVTLEDPVERTMEGLVQISVREDEGMDFSALLRRVLRHDPDVIMVGEIRDRETAALAVRAALTGHLVLTTIHSRSALGAVDRLRDMGVEPALLASALRILASQRLVRRLCPDCRKGIVPRGECLACGGTGFRGRHALWEVVPVDKELRQAISEGDDSTVLEGFVDRKLVPDLEESGRRALAAGITGLEELWRDVWEYGRTGTEAKH